LFFFFSPEVHSIAPEAWTWENDQITNKLNKSWAFSDLGKMQDRTLQPLEPEFPDFFG